MTEIIERRRKRRIAKQRKKRFVTALCLLSLIMILPQMMNLAFAKKSDEQVLVVTVSAGDTVWSIAKEIAPKNSDVRKLVHKIIDENCIVNGNIYSGQELIIPLD